MNPEIDGVKFVRKGARFEFQAENSEGWLVVTILEEPNAWECVVTARSKREERELFVVRMLSPSAKTAYRRAVQLARQSLERLGLFELLVRLQK